MPQIRWFPQGAQGDVAAERPEVLHGPDEGWDTRLVPPVDMFQRGTDVVVRVELPGVTPGDVDVRASRDVLRVRAERHETPGAPAVMYLRRETTGATYEREIPLPAGTDPESARARFRDGVLEVVIGQAARGAPRTRRVDVSVDYGGERGMRETVGIPAPEAAEIEPVPEGRPTDLRDRTDIRWPGGNLDAEGPYPEYPAWLEDYIAGGEEQEFGYSATGQAGPGIEEHAGFPEKRGDALVQESDLERDVRTDLEVTEEPTSPDEAERQEKREPENRGESREQ